MTNTTLVEVVRFQQDGLTQLAAETKAMGREVDEAAQKQKALAGLLANPVYPKYAQNLDRTRRQMELLNLRTRNTAAAQGLADGSAVRHMRSVEKLNKEYEKTRRVTEYVARYGDRAGRFFERHGAALRTVGETAAFGLTTVAGMGVGMARQGFAGTVEGARLEAEMKRLSRELAGVFKPAIDVATVGAGKVRRYLEGLDQRGQDTVMAGLSLAGTAGGTWMLRRFMGLDQAGGRFAGGRGFLRMGAGIAGAGLAGYGAYSGNIWSGAAGGAMLGWSLGGPVGALIGGTAGAGISAARKLAMEAPKMRAGENGMDYYARRRAEGQSRWGATKDFFGAYFDHLGSVFGDGKNGGPNPDRRQVQIAGGGYEASGTGYERLNSAIEKVTAEDADREKAESGLVRALTELTEEIRRGHTPAP